MDIVSKRPGGFGPPSVVQIYALVPVEGGLFDVDDTYR
jgi:hypothetical protein